MWVWYVLRVAYVGRGIYLTSPQLCSCESALSRFHAYFCYFALDHSAQEHLAKQATCLEALRNTIG